MRVEELAKLANRRSSVSSSSLKRMISEAIVDCCNDSEQVMGLFNMIEDTGHFMHRCWKPRIVDVHRSRSLAYNHAVVALGF